MDKINYALIAKTLFALIAAALCNYAPSIFSDSFSLFNNINIKVEIDEDDEDDKKLSTEAVNK